MLLLPFGVVVDAVGQEEGKRQRKIKGVQDGWGGDGRMDP